MGHRDSVTSVAVITGMQQWEIVSSSTDCSIKFWKFDLAPNAKIFPGHNQEVQTLAISPDQHFIATGSYDNSIKIINFDTTTEIRTLKGHSGIVNAVVISADCKLVVSGSSDKTIIIWDLELE